MSPIQLEFHFPPVDLSGLSKRKSKPKSYKSAVLALLAFRALPPPGLRAGLRAETELVIGAAVMLGARVVLWGELMAGEGLLVVVTHGVYVAIKQPSRIENPEW